MKHTLLPVDEFVLRRQRVFDLMSEQSIAFFPAGKEVTRSNDTEYLFCQNKNFYYLTGFPEPDGLLVLIKTRQGDKNKAILFCHDKNPLHEVWHGRRIGPVLAKTDYQFDHTYRLDDINDVVPELMDGQNNTYLCQGEHPDFTQQMLTWIQQLQAANRQGKKAPKQIIDCSYELHELRLIKSEAELAIMRQVNVISGQAHQRAMEKTTDGKFEYQIEAELLHEFARHGARHAAYNSIVAGGDNANILHYTDNTDVLNNGDLLLIDAGGELAGYAADITRTFPVSGQFSEPQKALYQLVLDAQNATISAIKPGETLGNLNDIANEIITTGLHQLGILTGNLTELIADKACKDYFIHGLGHWLGLDVHDVGDYQIDEQRRQARAFEAGMVMTIEPGLYIPLSNTDVDVKWRGIGIRIEDNILVTETGYENLTVTAPKSIEEIEALMAKARAKFTPQ